MYQAYVDGSYIDGAVGYGAVLLNEGVLVQEFSGSVAEDTDARQVAGELVATMTVLDYCEAQTIAQVEIIYDYKGIEQWATGGWKANKPLTQRYVAFIRRCPVRITWTKVKSHTGNRWNDRADELAKQGTGATESRKPLSQAGDTTLLEAIGEAFAVHLSARGIQAKFDSIKNNQYARIVIWDGKKRLGFFDLYNTKNRLLDPYLHGFSNNGLQAKIESYWTDYKTRL
jgi:ribonuclease HI